MNSIVSVSSISKKYQLPLSKKEASNSFLNSFFTKRKYEEYWAVNDVSFTLNKGDKLGIIGNNGAGKSTLLKILSKITKPTTGKVNIQGKVASLLEVGTGFHPELSGRDNIYLNGAILGMSKKQITQQFDEIVEFA
ncbi:MAG: ATP-binding cassette domain-containing protein, partial [Actinobacteria bacterium]|nr:ATP-binding cassette domain-containing protein [Actinomycetota bacterium]